MDTDGGVLWDMRLPAQVCKSTLMSALGYDSGALISGYDSIEALERAMHLWLRLLNVEGNLAWDARDMPAYGILILDEGEYHLFGQTYSPDGSGSFVWMTLALL